MVETSALKHRAESVARLMASRQLVALRIEGATHSVLLVERASLRHDFLFLAGGKPRVTELFRGSAVDLVLERSRLKAEAGRAGVVVAPWRFFEATPETLRWHPFLDAHLAVAASAEEQVAAVPSGSHQKKLRAAAGDAELKLSSSSAPGDFDRFYSELYVPFARNQPRPEPIDEQTALESAFAQGGSLALVTGRRGRLLAGALLLSRQRGSLTWHRTGFADSAALTSAQLAHRAAALEVAVFRHAGEKGFGQIDFGFAPSLLTDPRFVRLRRLGCALSPTPSSPALMLTVRRAVRPRLFARAPLLTGEPGAFVVQAGCWGEMKERALRAAVREFAVAGASRLVLSTELPNDAAARVQYERVLAQELPGVKVEVEQA